VGTKGKKLKIFLFQRRRKGFKTQSGGDVPDWIRERQGGGVCKSKKPQIGRDETLR